MLSCVTKEEFVDFSIQIIENSMGEENYLGSIESLFVIILSNISAYMRQKTKELNNPVRYNMISIVISTAASMRNVDVASVKSDHH